MELLFVTMYLLAGMAASVWFKKLTPAAAVCGGLAGFVIYFGTGLVGLALLSSFFVLGTAASAWKRKQKERYGLAENNKGQRKPGQVFANSGVAFGLALLAIYNTEATRFCTFMMAAAFASAAADTVSSELGNVYGKKFYNIINLKKDKRGLNGVVSIEGTLFGLAASICIAGVYAIGFGWSAGVLWIVVAGTIGNLADSVLGATAERNRLIKNNGVNFLNTLIGAIAGGLLSAAF